MKLMAVLSRQEGDQEEVSCPSPRYPNQKGRPFAYTGLRAAPKADGRFSVPASFRETERGKVISFPGFLSGFSEGVSKGLHKRSGQ
jgi:hypothetical protein